MYSYNEFDEIADRIASDIPARSSMSFDEALAIVAADDILAFESRTVREMAAVALYRSYGE
jgi:hypothetical protein